MREAPPQSSDTAAFSREIQALEPYMSSLIRNNRGTYLLPPEAARDLYPMLLEVITHILDDLKSTQERAAINHSVPDKAVCKLETLGCSHDMAKALVQRELDIWNAGRGFVPRSVLKRQEFEKNLDTYCSAITELQGRLDRLPTVAELVAYLLADHTWLGNKTEAQAYKRVRNFLDIHQARDPRFLKVLRPAKE